MFKNKNANSELKKENVVVNMVLVITTKSQVFEVDALKEKETKQNKIIDSWLGEKLDHHRSNGVIWTILVTKHLDANTKWLEVLLFYDFANDIRYEEEEILHHVELKLFTIKMITLPKLSTLMFDVTPKTSLKELKFDFLHTLGEIPIDEIPTHLKMHDLKIGRWTLQEDLNVGIDIEP